MTTSLLKPDAEACARALRSAGGLLLKTGPFTSRVRSPLPEVAAAVSLLYAGYPTAEADDFFDFDVAVRRPDGWRQIWKPQVTFELDGRTPFNPLPGDQGFPLLEWGLNWCIYGMCHQYLILHAAVLEKGGRALILPAPSGSGKSTLCAGLAFSGWRLLSDELALICPRSGELVPNPRPVSLKNQSIAVMQKFAPGLRLGSQVRETSKGVVAHFAAPDDAVARALARVRPGWVVLPRWVAGHPTSLRPLERAQGFMKLVENAFNYPVFGAQGFEMLAALVDQTPCYSFDYSDLDEATALFNRLADGQVPAMA